jgi:hypothetical protein
MYFVVDEKPCPFGRTDQERQRFEDQALRAVGHLEDLMDGTYGRAAGNECDEVRSLPWFLAEMSAVAQLGILQRTRRLRYLGHDLPTYEESLESLKARIQTSPEYFFREGPADPPLFEKVMAARSRAFQFSMDLGCEIMVTEIDEDDLIDSLAELLWRCRNQDATQR